MLYSDFKCKMVINLRNCKQLGRVSEGAYIRFLCPKEINGKASSNVRKITAFPTAISSRLARTSF